MVSYSETFIFNIEIISISIKRSSFRRVRIKMLVKFLTKLMRSCRPCEVA